ncbi:hypothetical protein J7F03_17745 [Streptomyces sp. ISL-43]|uniref:hypothetical protein n=1 Tax=Streptomyces sp. ISL-43 TaxID=2819183 RepID=UPI001BE7E993|nr:hypothetical protein [Streptomyces sp. ISL-43]MBT2448902.1 hypothetical protein [Streptomyces sp. ISL-43]
MSESNEIPAGQNGPDEDEWNAFVLAHAAGTPSAEPFVPKRAWPRAVLAVLLLAGLAFVALKFIGSPFDAGVTAPTSTQAEAQGKPGAGSAGSSTTAGERPMIPLAEAFPAQVPDGKGGTFTKVGAVVLESCTEPDSVGPGLAAALSDSGGCVGEQVALYKDAHGNQYNLALFTLKDPRDAVRLVTRLSMAFDDHQVGAQAPPPGSGLPVLPADSGMVQSFTSQGRVMAVGLGQWSDGRVADYQKLVDGLAPLLKAVSDRAARYETAR